MYGNTTVQISFIGATRVFIYDPANLSAQHVSSFTIPLRKLPIPEAHFYRVTSGRKDARTETTEEHTKRGTIIGLAAFGV